MLNLKAKVLNVFQTPLGTNRNGESYGGQHKVQLQAINKLTNGEERVELVTLTVKDPDLFKQAKGKEILVPVGAFAPQKNQVQFYITGTPQLPKTPQ